MRTQIVPGTPPCRRSDTIFCSGFEVVPSTTTNGSTSWTYASDGSRSSEQSSRGLRLYGRNGYEQIGALKVHELGPVVVTRSGTTDTVTAVLKDRLDSTVATIDTAVNRRSYDPFGAVRNGDYATRPNGTLNLAGTIHGFTGHTHADDVALIHMNGRIYDPNLGRFLSVDPIVQFPASTQSLNPYSYLMNNPMAGRDPSGYAQDCTGTHLQGVDCGGLGVTIAQIGTPSASEMRQSAAQALSAQSMDTMARHWNDKIANGADGQTSKGPSSQPNSGDPNGIAGISGTVGTASATQDSMWRQGYDAMSQGNLLERVGAWFGAAAGALVGPFLSEDEYGNARNPVTGEAIFAADAKQQRINAAAGVIVAPIQGMVQLPRVVVQESAQEIISRIAQGHAARGVDYLRGFMSQAERSAFDRNPAAGSRILGQMVHSQTAKSLQRLFPDRFEYRRIGPDFLDSLTGGQIELTTPSQVGAHMARPGYQNAEYAIYNLPVWNP